MEEKPGTIFLKKRVILMGAPLNNKKGFTLIEILISLAILGIIVFTFLNLFGTSFVNIYTMGGKDRAMAQASDIMEILYNQQEISGFENKAAIINAFPHDVTGSEDEGNFAIPGTNYTGSYKIQEINPFGDEIGGFKVLIEVFYQENGGGRQVSIDSFFRRKPDDE